MLANLHMSKDVVKIASYVLSIIASALAAYFMQPKVESTVKTAAVAVAASKPVKRVKAIGSGIKKGAWSLAGVKK